MTDNGPVATALNEIALQMRIRNCIELTRLAGQSGWSGGYLDNVTRALHLTVNDIYPPEQKDTE